MVERFKRPLRAVCAGTAVLLCAGLLGGCYERVVKASGPGQGRYTIYEPNRKLPEDRTSKNPDEAKTVPSKKIGDNR